MSVLEPSDYCDQFADDLRRLGLEPVLMGALAALRYRLHPRFTTDVDFLVPAFGDAVEHLTAEGYDIRPMAQPGDDPYLIFVRGRGVKVDLILAETDYHLEAHRRAVDGIITVEDVIIQKLLAWRPRDRDDVASILDVGHELDLAYIERWTAEWEVADRWAEVLRNQDL